VFAWRVKREDERVLVQQGVAVRNPCHALTNRTPSRKEMEKGRRSIPIRDAWNERQASWLSRGELGVMSKSGNPCDAQEREDQFMILIHSSPDSLSVCLGLPAVTLGLSPSTHSMPGIWNQPTGLPDTPKSRPRFRLFESSIYVVKRRSICIEYPSDTSMS